MPLSGAALLELMRAVLGRNVPFRFRARGSSMHPFVRDGDVVTVEPASSARMRPGDIAAFTDPDTGRLTVHRVATIRGGSFLMKGDNVEFIDGEIPRSSVLGRVARVERNGQRVWLGVGPERGLIAWLSHAGRLGSALAPARWVYRKFWKR